MQRTLITYQNLKQLILSSAFGCFTLSNLSGSESLGGSHLNRDDEAAINPEQLVECLDELILYIGPGDYKVNLKKTPKTQLGKEVTYRFFVPSQGHDHQKPQQNGMGFTPQDIDAKIAAAVTAALFQQRELDKRDREIEKLNAKLDEVKKEKRGEYDEALKQLGGLTKIIAAGYVIHKVPESKEVINAVLNGEIESEEKGEEKTIPVKRTD